MINNYNYKAKKVVNLRVFDFNKIRNKEMNLTKREDVLKLSGLVVAKDYKTSINIINVWLNENPFDHNAMSNFKGNKNPDKKKKYSGSPQDCYNKLLPVLEAMESLDPKSKLEKLFDGKTRINNINLFSDGNAKLRFLNYSTMPKVNCGGAGSCLTFCYSMKALRQPNVIVKWLATTILEGSAEGFSIIEKAFAYNIKRPTYKKELLENGNIAFRLYNDGDFQSLEKMVQWFKILKKFPMVKSYAYSKSLHIFKELIDIYGAEKIPSNFKLNLSSGIHPLFKGLKKTLANYDFVRGEFIGIDLGKKVKPTELTKENKIELRAKARAMGFKKSFVCGGICQSCTSKGHACGMSRLKDVAIITPIH